MVLGNEKMRSSCEISFATLAIHLDLGLSYDLEKEEQIEINVFEGLLAACVLDGEGMANQVIDLNGRKAFKAKLLA